MTDLNLYMTEPTRRVLEERGTLTYPDAPVFFNTELYATLKAVCARLIPESNVAPAIDRRLAEGVGKGWRYDELPDEREMFRLGLTELGKHFPLQDERIAALAESGDRFFEELLAMAVEIHYAQPATQAGIQYFGYADAVGWTHIGLNQYEPWEPRDR